MKWTDKEIDKLFRNAAEKHTFRYDNSYWEAFEQSLPPVQTEWTDEALDNLFKGAADKHSIQYENAYWKEFEQSLPPVQTGWTDGEIDDLFVHEARDINVPYKEVYWTEFESTLPAERRRDVLWFFFSLTAISLLTVMMLKPVNQDQGDQNLFVSQDESGISSSQKKASDNAESDADNMEYSAENNATAKVNASSSLTGNDLNEMNQSSFKGQTPSFNAQQGEVISSEQIGLSSELLPTLIPGESSEIQLPNDYNTELEAKQVEFIALSNDVNTPQPRDFVGVRDKVLMSGYVQVFGGISQSLITPSEDLSLNYGVGAGLRFGFGHLSLNTGLNMVISHHEDLELTRTAKVYGFGSTLYQHHLDYEQLYLLEGDLRLTYNHRRSSFSIGVRPSYLLSTKVHVNQNDLNQGNTLIENTDNRLIYGFNEGIKSFGLKPMIGYSYLMNRPGIELGVNIGMQVSQLINEDFINGQNNRLPIDGQIYLRKYLHLRK